MESLEPTVASQENTFLLRSGIQEMEFPHGAPREIGKRNPKFVATRNVEYHCMNRQSKVQKAGNLALPAWT